MASFTPTCPTTLGTAVVALTAAMGVVRLDGSREAGINLLKAITSITGLKTRLLKTVSINQDRVNNRDQGQRRRVMSPEELGIAPGQRGGRYGGGGMRVQGGGDDYWREQNKRIADNRRRGIAGKDKRYGGRGVSTVDVFGPGRRPGKKQRLWRKRRKH